MEATDTQPSGRGLLVWVAIVIALLLLTFLGAASIGIFFLPTLAGMALSISVWKWRWAVVGLTAAGIAFSLAYAATVPLSCWIASSADIGDTTAVERTSESGCGRLLLPNLPGQDATEAEALALRIAGGSAAAFGILAGATTFAITKRRAPRELG